MKRNPVALVAVVVSISAVSWTLGAGRDAQAEKKAVVFAAAEKAEFKEVLPGVSKSVIWGDPDKGAYGAFTKFKAGFDAGMHVHSSDVRIVGIKGAYVFRTDAGETRVGPGCFLSVAAGTKHWSGGDAKDGALFYEEGSGKFDLTPAK